MTATIRGLLTAFLCVAAASLGGCRWVDDALAPLFADALKREVAEAVGPLQQEAAASRKTLSEHTAALEKLRQDYDSLKKQVDILDRSFKFSRTEYKTDSATLTSDGNGYGIARTDIGTAVVSVENMEPYLEGFKIKLWITMLVPIDVVGIKGTLSWFEQDQEVLKKDKTVFRDKEFASTERFQSGRYTQVEVVVSPASAAGLKSFYVALTTNQVAASRPYGAPAK